MTAAMATCQPASSRRRREGASGRPRVRTGGPTRHRPERRAHGFLEEAGVAGRLASSLPAAALPIAVKEGRKGSRASVGDAALHSPFLLSHILDEQEKLKKLE